MQITKILLSNSEINHSGVEHSIVFVALSEQQRQQIANMASEPEKFTLACQFGDKSESVKKIYRDVVEEPARRAKEGHPFPSTRDIVSGIFSR